MSNEFHKYHSKVIYRSWSDVILEIKGEKFSIPYSGIEEKCLKTMPTKLDTKWNVLIADWAATSSGLK
jgi:hypothetical protein